MALRLAGLAVLAAATAAHAACRVDRLASVPMRAGPAGWAVPLTINATPVPFLLDTGASRSMVFEDAADRLSLARDEWVATSVRGVGGVVRRRNALPRALTLGGIALRRRTVASDMSLTVGPPVGQGAAGLAGLLGSDLLASLDVEIDAAHMTLGLMAVSGCGGRFLPWSVPYDAVPMQRVTPSVTLIPVEADGTRLDALLDTGSALTLLSTTGAARLAPAPPAASGDGSREIAGIGAGIVRVHARRLRIAVGDGAAREMAVWIGPVNLLRSVDIVLGRDWIAGRALWLSPASGTLFVAHGP